MNAPLSTGSVVNWLIVQLMLISYGEHGLRRVTGSVKISFEFCCMLRMVSVDICGVKQFKSVIAPL